LVLPQKVFDELHIPNKKGYDSCKNIIVVVVFDAVVNEGKKTKKGNGKGHKRSSCIETHFKLLFGILYLFSIYLRLLLLLFIIIK